MRLWPYTGVDRSRDHCYGDQPVSFRTFACDTDAGAQVLVGSFVAPAGIEAMTASEITLQVRGTGALPDWWGFQNSGACRQSAAVISFVPSAEDLPCVSPYAVSPAGGIGAYQLFPSGTYVRFLQPTNAWSNIVEWQRSLSFPDPVRDATWGGVKALYRWIAPGPSDGSVAGSGADSGCGSSRGPEWVWAEGPLRPGTGPSSPFLPLSSVRAPEMLTTSCRRVNSSGGEKKSYPS